MADDPILRSLAEAIAWCEPRVDLEDPAHCLRSSELEPSISIEDFIHEMSHQQRLDVVETVVRKRRAALGEQVEAATSLAGGKLMAMEPDETLSDGAARVGSRGFFDDDNVPAWGTWVCYATDGVNRRRTDSRIFLVAWIPSAMIALAEEALWMNPEDCIWWLENGKTELEQELRRSGVL